jgi:hypothetical protein
MRARIASEMDRLPLSAYETVLRATPTRRAISPMLRRLVRASVGGSGRDR